MKIIFFTQSVKILFNDPAVYILECLQLCLHVCLPVCFYYSIVEILLLFLFIYIIYLFYIIMGPNFVEYTVYPVESVPTCPKNIKKTKKKLYAVHKVISTSYILRVKLCSFVLRIFHCFLSNCWLLYNYLMWNIHERHFRDDTIVCHNTVIYIHNIDVHYWLFL